MPRLRLETAWLCALWLGGCAAHVKAEAHASGSINEPDDRKGETGEKPETASPTPALAASSPPPPPLRLFVGALHDLSLAPSAATTPACTCLAVAYGAPSDPKFVWQLGRPPEVDADTIAVAISGDVGCRAPVKGQAAPPSIAGLSRQGDDVVVTVEAARGGRPVVRGALTQRPGPNGAILVKSRGRVPFGAPLGGHGVCRIPVT